MSFTPTAADAAIKPTVAPTTLTFTPANYASSQSVSVTAPQAVLAGCISTIAMLKEGDGLAFLQASGCRFLAVDAAGQIHHN